ncbi:MAG: hypothetical protein PHY47_28680 [Lachnospiraceae bacterium]|nr:hypothetical protein [Lachnospiraceae bacterium]
MSIDGIGEYGTGNYVVKNNSAILTVVDSIDRYKCISRRTRYIK